MQLFSSYIRFGGSLA